MKLTIQKILICALSLIVSIGACVCGMYMTILAHMLMRYRIIFCLFFLLNPVLVIFMIRFMFRKPVPKEETDGAYTGNSYGDTGSTYGNTGYTMSADTDVSAAVSEIPETQSVTSSFADELDDDIDFSGSVAEKTAGPVTEDSVAKFKKISLKRKKRADE
jgi:hypothetical protein